MIYPRYSGKIVFKNGKHRKCNTRFKRRLLSFYKASSGKVYVLMVRYAHGFSNEGEYKTKKDLYHAYKAFTEKDLIDEFLETPVWKGGKRVS